MLLEIALIGVSTALWMKSDAGPGQIGQGKSAQRSRLTGHAGRMAMAFRAVLSGGAQAAQSAERGGEQNDAFVALQRDGLRRISIAGAALALAGVGLVAPVFSVIGGVVVLVLMRPLFVQCWQDLRQGTVSSFVIDSVLIVGLLAMGQVIFAALIAVLTSITVHRLNAIEFTARYVLVEGLDLRDVMVSVERGGAVVPVRADEVEIGDFIRAKTGDVIVVDGVIVEGAGRLDPHASSGNTAPMRRTVGDRLLAGSVLREGTLRLRALTVEADSTATRICDSLEMAAGHSDRLTVQGDTISTMAVLPSLALAGLAWALLGPAAGLVVLYVPLGVDMRATGPLAMLNTLRTLSRRAVVIKEGAALENLSDVDAVVFDIASMDTVPRPETVDALKAQGRDVILMTDADTPETRQMARMMGVDRCILAHRSEDKAAFVTSLQTEGHVVCCVGDGIRDRGPLEAATVSLCVGGAAGLATDAAGITLMQGDLGQVPMLFDTAAQFETTMERNFILAVTPGIVAIGGVFLADFTLLTAIALRYGGLTAGMINTMLPMRDGADDSSALPLTSADRPVP